MRRDRMVTGGLVVVAAAVVSAGALTAQSRFGSIDYADVDRDRDGVITRAEWQAAFNAVDSNRDGVLSGDEMRGRGGPQGSGLPRASRPALSQGALREQFVSLDRSGDGIISRGEWRATRDEFDDLDLNRDNQISRREFGIDGSAGRDGNRTLDVDARSSWVSTGLIVIAGETLAFNTEGTVQLSDDADDTANPAGALSGRLASNAPMPQALAGALIGRIGRSAPFAIGDLRQITAPASGELFLAVNDDHVQDNRGRFRVRVSLR